MISFYGFSKHFLDLFEALFRPFRTHNNVITTIQNTAIITMSDTDETSYAPSNEDGSVQDELNDETADVPNSTVSMQESIILLKKSCSKIILGIRQVS